MQQADSVVQSKNSVLVPLQWIIALLGALFIALLLGKAPNWALVGDGLCFVVVLLTALAYYAYFASRAPDCLRSEQYSLSKFAIQHGLYGDNDTGLIEGRPNSGNLSSNIQVEARDLK